jgi:hypothetical protein
MDFLALFYAPMKLVLAWPAAPFLLAAVFATLQVALLIRQRQRPAMILWRRPALFAAAIWVVYALYELQVQATMPTANIRIDLLVLAPILYVFTAVAVWWIAREWRGVNAPPPAPENEQA